MRFHIVTFGCQMNVADSGWLARSLTAQGWEQASMEEAEVFVVNTCSVRDKPEQKVYSVLGRIRELLAEKPRGFAAVGGCVAQQVGPKLAGRFADVRCIFGTDGIAMVPQALERIAREPRLRVNLLEFTDSYAERDAGWLDDPDTPAQPSAFVTIMQGCDNFCAYCIVPYVRGRQKSRDMAAVLAECEALAARGTVELTLLGQNVNSYGQDLGPGAPGFAELLRRVAAIPGIARVRFTTSHPKDIAPEVVRAFGELPNLCPSLHLPLQSGSDAVLAAMGRKYDTARYLGIVDALRDARPGLELTTDLIVGFPGETQADFEKTLAIMDRVRFHGSFSFKYNDRPGVRAEKMEPKIPEPEKSFRLEILQKRQEELTTECYAAAVGSEVEVLFETEGRPRAPLDDGTYPPMQWQGRDQYGRTVNVDTPVGVDLTGRVRRVRITQSKRHSLKGTLAEELT